MKSIKQLATITLSLLMTLLLAASALAAGECSISIINNKPGHTYEAYQIFSGDLSNDNVLSNIEWGTGVKGTDLLAALQLADASKYGSCTTAADVAKALSGESGSPTAADIKAFAKIAAEHLKETATGTANEPSEGKYTISGLDTGYYLVKDKDNSLPEGSKDSYTRYIIQVLGNVEIDPKSDVPSSEKKVKDINDSLTATYGAWADTADHDIGDRIPFQLKAILPENYTDYETYTLTFHDIQSAGLTFDKDSVKVYINSIQVNTGYEVVTEGLSEDVTFEIRFADLKTVTAADGTKATNESVITVEYESTLNDTAKIGAVGNPNDMYITFSNNPNGIGTGSTPRDTVIVFTYKVDVDKVNNKQEPLSGAEFTLEKKITGEAGDRWEIVDVMGTEGNLTEFGFTGLDDGVYRLTETKTPTGYNTIDPIEFTVTATHDDATLELTGLTGQVATGDLQFTPDVQNGSLSVTVVNNQGSTLPETGGIGTTIFFVLGGALMVGAGVLLVVRIRMRAGNKE